MSKDAYYFSHDCNARNDPKILRVRSKYGNEGYALYFMIIEMLREADSYRLPSDWLAIAYGISSDPKIIEDIVMGFDLFVFSETEFYSQSLMNRMKSLEEKRKKCKESGRLGGIANAKRTLKRPSSDPLAVKKSKVKESKTKESLVQKDSDAYKLANYLFKKIRVRNPSFKEPDVSKWAVAVDKMLRIDGRDPEVIAQVIDWCQEDSFWQSNILSTEKLRKQFDQLFMKMSTPVKLRPDQGLDERTKWLLNNRLD